MKKINLLNGKWLKYFNHASVACFTFKVFRKVWPCRKPGTQEKRRDERGTGSLRTEYLIGFVLSAVFKLSIVLLLSSSSSFSKASKDFLYAKKIKKYFFTFSPLIIVQVKQAHKLYAFIILIEIMSMIKIYYPLKCRATWPPIL